MTPPPVPLNPPMDRAPVILITMFVYIDLHTKDVNGRPIRLLMPFVLICLRAICQPRLPMLCEASFLCVFEESLMLCV